tara:strand:+ start:743 stop:919 length:177 start_codon:yes stop_codon:yes gene_type:complete
MVALESWGKGPVESIQVRGMELAKHTEFTQKTNMPVYFCDPQSPWQRGTNENTNYMLL